MRISRKDFLKGTLSFAVVGVLAPACGGDDESGSGGASSSSATTTTGDATSTSTTGDATSTSTSADTTSTTASGTGGGGQGGAGEGGTGQGGAGGASPASCLDNGTNVTIAGNHGHVLAVPKEDVAAGVDKTYDITGAAAHAHSVTVTAADFAMLAGNTSVMVTSSSGAAHTHLCTVVCA